MAAPCFALRHSFASHGLTCGQTKCAAASTAATISGISTGWAAKKLLDSSAGEPFDTVCGRETATPTTISAQHDEEERLDDRSRGHAGHRGARDAGPEDADHRGRPRLRRR